MEWTEISITTKSGAVEAITGIIHDMGVNVSILDPKDIINYKPKLNWIELDDNLIPKNIELAVIKAYFPKDNISDKVNFLKEKMIYISDFIDTGEYRIDVNVVKEEDWTNSWKKYYKPVKVGKRIIIKPTWEEYTQKDHDVVVELDPGMAFGTGTHETTRMCIELLEKFVDHKKVVFDVGCGSGILGICACKLGAKNVIACDIDSVSVSSAKKNAVLNSACNFKVQEGNLLDVFNEKADIIVSNITADIIISISQIIKGYLNEDGVFICSGIIKDRLLEVLKTFTNNGLKVIKMVCEGEWIALTATYNKDC